MKKFMLFLIAILSISDQLKGIVKTFVNNSSKDFFVKKWLFPPKSLGREKIVRRLWRNLKECSVEEFKDVFNKKFNKGGCIGKLLINCKTTLDFEKIRNEYLQLLGCYETISTTIETEIPNHSSVESNGDKNNFTSVFQDLQTPEISKYSSDLFGKKMTMLLRRRIVQMYL